MLDLKRNIENYKVFYGYGITFTIIVILLVIYREQLSLIFKDPESVKAFVSSFGIWAPLLLIFLHIFQSVIFVIPGPMITVAAGYAFGWFWGSVYSLIGLMCGSSVVFYFGRKYGRPFVERWISKKELKHFDAAFKERGEMVLIATRTVPILFSNDVVSFASSLTPLSYRRYFWISVFGFIPHIIVLIYLGNELQSGSNGLVVTYLSILATCFILYMFRHPIKMVLLKEIRKIEKKFFDL